MRLFNDAYLEKVEECWHTYVEKGLPIPESEIGVRRIILQSWKRSASYGVDFFPKEHPRASEEEFEGILEKNRRFVDIARPYILNLYNFIEGSDFGVHITEETGCTLELLANDKMVKNLTHNIIGNTPGSYRNERLTGTDSTALCLAVDEPVQVIGAEHYQKTSHGFICSSSPIHDEHKRVIGSLTVMGPKELYQHHTLGMVCAAVDGIEKAIYMKNAYDKLLLTNQAIALMMDSSNRGIFMLDEYDRIVHYNKNAIKVFKLEEKEELAGKSIYDVIEKISLPEMLHGLRRQISNFNFLAINCKGKAIDISLTVKITEKNNIGRRYTILFAEEQKSLNRLVSKISNLSATYTFDSIIGDSERMLEMKETARRFAASTSNILILGESGTGKELVAQAIHNVGDRAEGPFVALNCGSIPKNLIESELFGYESGAFSGARKSGNPGKFELADGGTLFLDEIGDMPLELQVSLLRVLQTHQITRLGGKYPKEVDVRIIAATNVDLEEAVANHYFRQDLYYRLNVLTLELPPLRQRKEDVKLLAYYFAQKYGKALDKKISVIRSEAMNLLVDYSWPGNVRELENVMERAVNLLEADSLSVSHLPETLKVAKRPKPGRGELEGLDSEKQISKKIQERERIIKELKTEKGDVRCVSEKLGIPLSTLYKKLKKYQINVKNYRDWHA